MQLRSIALTAALTLLASSQTGYAEVARERPRAAVKLTKKRAARAAELRQRGLEHYLSREYQLASAALMEAYRIDKRPETLFGWAEAVRANGDCELASRIYGRLLAKTSDSKLTAQAEVGLSACADQAAITETAADDVVVIDGEPEDGEEDADASEASEPVPEAGAPAAAAAMTSPEASVAAASDVSHTASYILLGTGGVLGLGGLVTYATASTGSSRPNATHADITSARSRGDWYRLIGASVAATGVTVALIGLVVYRSENRTAADRRLSVAPFVAGAGAGIAFSGQF